jgi:hypothetical protein
VGCPNYPWYGTVDFNNDDPNGHRVFHNYGGPLPFPRLISFEYFQRVCSPYLIQSIQACPTIQKLALAWDGRASFPQMEHLPSVQTLRLYVTTDVMRQDYAYNYNPPIFRSDYSAITTLALYDCCKRSEVMLECMKLSFPNLRILRLEGCDMSAPEVYDFIQLHPTILEATVYFFALDYRALRLEPLLKLIDGTGTWKAPSGNQHAVLDQPSMAEMDEDHPVPDNFADDYGPFYRFSFSRTPIHPSALKWSSSEGSQYPRYHCTGLALDLAEGEEESDDWDTPLDFIRHMKPFVPDLEELRLFTSALTWECQSFGCMMVSNIATDSRGPSC